MACWPDRAARARAAFDLAIISVFLDAGAGAQWRYFDRASGKHIGRSEGLALASLDMFARGDVFERDPTDPLRVDATVLAQLSAEQLSEGFRVADNNPLVGIEGRAALLRALGTLASQHSRCICPQRQSAARRHVSIIWRRIAERSHDCGVRNSVDTSARVGANLAVAHYTRRCPVRAIAGVIQR